MRSSTMATGPSGETGKFTQINRVTDAIELVPNRYGDVFAFDKGRVNVVSAVELKCTTLDGDFLGGFR